MMIKVTVQIPERLLEKLRNLDYPPKPTRFRWLTPEEGRKQTARQYARYRAILRRVKIASN